MMAGFKLIGRSGFALVVLLAVGWLLLPGAAFPVVDGVLTALWLLFVAFTLYFFRDPEAKAPAGNRLVLAPGHGKVDTIDRTTEPEFLRGECQRISIFLSVFDVHVQNAPVTGQVAFFKHTPGQYLNALRADCAKFNENVLIGLDVADAKGARIGVRLIAGLIARRIVPWVAQHDLIQRSERISLIQFGSRVNVYLPLNARINVQLGDRVVGGESVLAELAEG